MKSLVFRCIILQLDNVELGIASCLAQTIKRITKLSMHIVRYIDLQEWFRTVLFLQGKGVVNTTLFFVKKLLV